MTNYYAGIGSRSTPRAICDSMTQIATKLESAGWVLRSGHADGADLAFEKGIIDPRNKEIYVPYAGFNGSPSTLTHLTPEAFRIAAQYHPRWDLCDDRARKLHARNVSQILGEDLESHSKFVICWTPDGSTGITTRGTGGTGQAIRIAAGYNIPIYNLAIPAMRVNVLKKLGL